MSVRDQWVHGCGGNCPLAVYGPGDNNYGRGWGPNTSDSVARYTTHPPIPEPDSVRICRNCRFFVAAPAFGGFCHRHAPVFVGEGIAKPEAWPFLSGEDFCGEWEAGVTE